MPEGSVFVAHDPSVSRIGRAEARATSPTFGRGGKSENTVQYGVLETTKNTVRDGVP
jgi:hypothetical protein